jgi:hypothetical protein
MLHLTQMGVMNEDGTLGPPALRAPVAPILLAPALVGEEAAIAFKPDGRWTSLATTKKKRRSALRRCPPAATRNAIGRAVAKALRPGHATLAWDPPISFAPSLKMPITNEELPLDDPLRTANMTFRAMNKFQGKPRHDTVKVRTAITYFLVISSQSQVRMELQILFANPIGNIKPIYFPS